MLKWSSLLTSCQRANYIKTMLNIWVSKTKAIRLVPKKQNTVPKTVIKAKIEFHSKNNRCQASEREREREREKKKT